MVQIEFICVTTSAAATLTKTRDSWAVCARLRFLLSVSLYRCLGMMYSKLSVGRYSLGACND